MTSESTTDNDPPSPTPAGGSLFGPGPFMDDLHRTPVVLWLSVALMAVGIALVGGGVVALSMSTGTAVALFLFGGVLGTVGLVLAARHHVMRNVD
jgi:hypothetical protein